MNIKVSKNDDNVYLVKILGTLDLSSSTELKDIVMKIIRNAIECLVINLNGVKSIDSTGIGALLNIFSTLRKLNCPVVIIAPDGPIMQALEANRIKSYFAIAGSLKEAALLTWNVKA